MAKRGTKAQRLPRGMRQPVLVDAPAKADMAFLAYHHAHQEIYAKFRLIADQLYRRGVRHYSAKAICEVIRYQTLVSAKGPGEPFKVNNSAISRYARLLMAEDARFVGWFELRALRSEAA